MKSRDRVIEDGFDQVASIHKTQECISKQKQQGYIQFTNNFIIGIKMGEYTEQPSYTPRDRVVKWLHLIMISLCVLATFALYNNPSTGVKLIISILLIVYTLTIILNSRNVRLIFKIGDNETEHSYRSLHQWNNEGEQGEKEQQGPKFKEEVQNETKFPQDRRENDSFLNQSVSKSDRSQDIKNMSMSIYRSLSASGLSDSRMSRIKTSKRTRQLRGYDLSEAFMGKSESSLNASTVRSQGSGIVLVDTQTYLSNKTERFIEQAQESYQKVLKKRLKKDRKFIGRKYESISNFVKNFVKSYINQHKFASEKLKDLSKEFFEIVLTDNNFKVDNNTSIRKTISNKIPFNTFVYRLLLLKEEKMKIATAGLPLKPDSRWSSAQPRLQEALRTMIRLAETLGIDASLLKSNFLDNTQKFVEEYFNAIEMLETYSQFESKEKRTQQNNCSTLCYWSKCRSFVLYLMVRHINDSLKYAGKVKFNDNLNLRYPPAEKYAYEITKRPGTEDPLIHYDLSILQDGGSKEQICCEPGQRNYLCVLYFLLLQLSNKADLLAWNADIKQLVNQIA